MSAIKASSSRKAELADVLRDIGQQLDLQAALGVDEVADLIRAIGERNGDVHGLLDVFDGAHDKA